MAIMCTALTMQAQSGIIKTRQANRQDAKMLTMEETILSRSLAPQNLMCRWNGNEELLMFKEDKWVRYDINTEATQPYKPLKDRPFAYSKGNSLYLLDKDSTSIPVAISEDRNISYGQVVSRNEFGISSGIFPSPDSTKVAFYRKDESSVSSFPLLDITTRTGSLKEIRYPMAGMDSEKVSLGVYDIATGRTIYVKADDFTDERYLTNVTWSPDSRTIFIQVLDRSQKHMRLNMYDAADGSFIRTILTEDSEKYTEPLDPLYFVKENENMFIYRTASRDGYRNLYLCDTEGRCRRLTCPG